MIDTIKLTMAFMTGYIMSSPSSSSSFETSRYPVRFKDCGSPYQWKLYNVDGNVLIGEASGQYLNVYTDELSKAFKDGTIRWMHAMKPGYRYFIRNQSQMDIFQEERTYGSIHENKTFFIYADDDMDKTTLAQQGIRLIPKRSSCFTG